LVKTPFDSARLPPAINWPEFKVTKTVRFGSTSRSALAHVLLFLRHHLRVQFPMLLMNNFNLSPAYAKTSFRRFGMAARLLSPEIEDNEA